MHLGKLKGRMYVVDKRTETEKLLHLKETTSAASPSEVRKYPAVIPSHEPTERVSPQEIPFLLHVLHVLKEQCKQVHGLLFHVPDEHKDEVFRALDEYEDVVDLPGSLAEYRRDQVVVRMHDNEEVDAWMYLWVKEVQDFLHVEDGDYRSVYIMRDDTETSN